MLRGLTVGVVLATLVTACPPPKPPKGGTRVTTDGTPPEFPIDFEPPPSLGAPPPPEPGAFGLVYLEQIYPPLRDAWTAFLEDLRLRLPPSDPLNNSTLAVTLTLTLGRHGELIELVTANPSGNADFDAVAREVVQESAPFPAPPREAISDDDLVYVTWLFARDVRQAGVATAQLRRVEWPLDRAVPKLLEAGDTTGAAQRVASHVAPDATAASLPSGEADRVLGVGERVFTAVVREALLSTDAEVQRVAVAAAAAARITGAAHELRGIADGSLDVELRGAAIGALGAIGDAAAGPMLLAGLHRDEGGNADISAAAAQAIAQLGQESEIAEVTAVVRDWLKSAEKQKRLAALVVLARFAAPGATTTLSGLVDPKNERDVRVASCTALGTAAKQDAVAALKALQKGLDDKEAAVRAACATGLARAAEAGASSRAAFWKLTPLFKDRDDRVRAAAALASARLEPSRFLKEAEVLGKEKSAVVLASIAEGLTGVPGKAAVDRLTTLAGHADVAVRLAAVTALAARSEPGARAAAATAFADGSADVRVRLAAVPAIDDPAVLAGALSDDAPDLRRAALGRIVLLRGRLATLSEMAARIAEAPPGGSERARLAQAWLSAR